jgi:RNA polymerase sigma-70 factor (ECF subfamily)
VQRDLVVRAQHGDVEAFSALAGGALGRLHAVAYRILRDPDRADDATQQALIAAWDHLGGLRDPDRFDAWTYRLVVNAAVKEAGRRSRRESVSFVDPPGAGDPDPSTGLAVRDELERAFRTLSPEHRAVVVLHYYADLPQPEIAHILGVPVGTVASRLHHAVRRLRLALGVAAPGVVSNGSPVT